MSMNRRGFLGAILATGMAPAFVKAGVLMPIKTIWTPPPIQLEFSNECWNGNEMWNFGRDVTDWVNQEVKRLDRTGGWIVIPPDGFIDFSRLRA